MSGKVSLASFDNAWYSPGRPLLVRAALDGAEPPLPARPASPGPPRSRPPCSAPSAPASGQGVVLKPHLHVKYPWHLSVGDHSWIGEGVWIDSLGPVRIGSDACLSQGVMVETGNHDWSRPTFDLLVKEVVVEDGAWAAVRSLLLPGARLASHAVLGAGSVLSGATEPYGIYVGVPATRVRERVIQPGTP